jgi:uncharacterized protein YyaL (SSP411 family)
MEQQSHEFTNRLVNEKSPYLLQHAHNPVDWYPWGVEAFNAAHEAQKPIFLSIGYATCHWCHVMEQESFADPEVAKALNEAFICIKVDREELPEIDSLYMEFAQTMIVGSAGWPLNLILTPDLKPFFAATYLPKESDRGLVGVIELTQKISELWQGEEQERIISQADRIVDILRAHVHMQGSDLPGPEPIANTAEILFRIADPIWGGMQGAPKFPLGYQSNFLLREYQRTQDSRALFLVERTLEMMHRGGIYDHLGGGFHRYSVDEHWHIPHFEKMLYDNALLAYGYLEAYRVTSRPIYKEVCQEILRFAQTVLLSPEGAFYTAQDADTAGVEGLFYTWTNKEVVSLLGESIGTLFCEYYGIYEHGLIEGRSVMHTHNSLEEFCTNRGLEVKEIGEVFTNAKQALLKEREQRIKPFRDEKIITSWNGLMIHAFAEAGMFLQNPEYLAIATKAAQFISDKLYKDTKLLRRFCDGDARFAASLEDYAFYIRALLTLFEAGQGSKWLELATELTDTLEQEFKEREGAFYQAEQGEDHLLIRKSHFADGAEPSGNAVHAENLIRLYQITNNKKYLQQAEDIFKAAKRYLDSYPLGYCFQLIALERYYDPKKKSVVIAYNSAKDLQAEIESALAKRRSPHHVIITNGPYLKPVLNNQTTLYLCQEGACQAPLTNKEEILKALETL